MDQNLNIAAEGFSNLIDTLTKEDRRRPGLRDTPRRAAASWQEKMSGYDTDPVSDLLKTFDEEGVRGQIILLRNCPFFSTCEHHLEPFFGIASIGYLPRGDEVVGLSKLQRLLNAISRRLQVQERLTKQIADSLLSAPLRPLAVGVVIQARHLCMESRGVHAFGQTTITSHFLSIETDFNAKNRLDKFQSDFYHLLSL